MLCFEERKKLLTREGKNGPYILIMIKVSYHVIVLRSKYHKNVWNYVGIKNQLDFYCVGLIITWLNICYIVCVDLLTEHFVL